jgi:hypothetical protein
MPTGIDDELERLIRNPDTSVSVLDGLVGKSVKGDRLLAMNERLSVGTFRKLAASPDRMTRRNLTANPQAPVDVLLHLAPTFPRELFANPVFDLLLLETPDLLETLPVSVMKSFLKQDDCPDSILIWAARRGRKSHQLAVVTRNTAPRSLLQQIASSGYSQPAEMAASRLMSGEGVVES